MTTIDEAIAAATACHETKVPTWLAFTVADDETGAMRSGESLQDAVQKLNDFNIEAFLINCCAPESVVPALKQLKTVTDLPVGAYANGFRQIPEKWQSGKIEQLGTREELTPTVYTEFVKTWIDEGASIVGGCCEISPAHIQEISKMLEA